MLSPEGQEFPNLGCYLEIIPNEQLIWTNALEPGYRVYGLTIKPKRLLSFILRFFTIQRSAKSVAIARLGRNLMENQQEQ